MKIYLNRTRTRQLTTDGVLLSSNGVRICDTAEHTPTMLPAGVYKVKFKHHRKYMHRAPHLTPNPGSASPSFSAGAMKAAKPSAPVIGKGAEMPGVTNALAHNEVDGEAFVEGQNAETSQSDVGIGAAFMIHGNGVHARDFGTTIIVGEHLVPGVVLNSQRYFWQIVKRIEKALKRRHNVEIIIR